MVTTRQQLHQARMCYYRNDSSYQDHWNDACSTFQGKFDRIKSIDSSLPIQQYEWYTSSTYTPELADLARDAGLCKPVVQITYKVAKESGRLEDSLIKKDSGNIVPVYKTEEGFMVDNPYVVMYSTQFWSNPQSQKVEKHRGARRDEGYTSRHASKFFNDVVVEDLEKETFLNATGVLCSAHHMFLYASFPESIGIDRTGVETQFMCLDVHRVKDPKKEQGHVCQIHGYPISEKEFIDR